MTRPALLSFMLYTVPLRHNHDAIRELTSSFKNVNNGDTEMICRINKKYEILSVLLDFMSF